MLCVAALYPHSADSSSWCSSAPEQGWQSWDVSFLRDEGKHRGQAGLGKTGQGARCGLPGMPGSSSGALQEPKLFTQAGTGANLQVQPDPHQGVWLFLLRGSGTSHRLCFSPCQHHTPETQTESCPAASPKGFRKGTGPVLGPPS